MLAHRTVDIGAPAGRNAIPTHSSRRHDATNHRQIGGYDRPPVVGLREHIAIFVPARGVPPGKCSRNKALERSLDCLPTTLNVGAAQTNSLPGCTAIISRRPFGEISTPDFR